MKKYTVDDNPSMKFCSVIHGFSILLLIFGILIVLSGISFLFFGEYDHMYIAGGVCTIVPAVGIMLNISNRKMVSVICSYIVPFLPSIYLLLMTVSGFILSDYGLIELGSTYAMVFAAIAVIIDIPIYIYFTKRRCFFLPVPSDCSNQTDFDGEHKEQVEEVIYVPVEGNCDESAQVISDKPCEPEDGIKFCFSCGAMLDSDSIFCMKCGTKVR